jgi:hypothetical protein
MQEFNGLIANQFKKFAISLIVVAAGPLEQLNLSVTEFAFSLIKVLKQEFLQKICWHAVEFSVV